MDHFLIFSSSPGGKIDPHSLASDGPITKRTFVLLCHPCLDNLSHTPSLLVLVPSPVLYLMHRGILRWQNIKGLTFPGCSESISTLLCVSWDVWRCLTLTEL